MLKLKLYSKVIPIFLIVTILFTACDVPDISKFTEASAEMTRGIRQGIKETGIVLEAAAARDFVSGNAKSEIGKSSKNYNATVKPTLKALDSLDAYLEALNALALANKKSRENAEAAVTAVSNLVTAVSGLQPPDTALKIGTVFTSILNQIKTSKDFKKRVTLVELIVNGGSSDSDQLCVLDYAQTNRNLRNALESMFPDIQSQRLRLERPLNLTSDIDIETAKLSKDIKDLVEGIEAAPNQTEKDRLEREKNTKETRLSELERGKRFIQKVYDGKIVSLSEKERAMWLEKAGNNFCGVIDILKLNMKDLKNIQAAALNILVNSVVSDNATVIKFHDNIISNDLAVQRKINAILTYKNNRGTLQEYILGEPADKIDDLEVSIAATLNSIKATDDTVQPAIDVATRKSEADCAQERNCPKTPEAIEKRLQANIILVLENREKDLMAENSRLIAELNRINPLYTKITNEIARLKNKQKELNSLFESSIEALDTWGQTHSNLRVSLNSKQPLTVSRLISKTKEIWEILKPEETDNK